MKDTHAVVRRVEDEQPDNNGVRLRERSRDVEQRAAQLRSLAMALVYDRCYSLRRQ